jgi:hypothetical protein
MEYNLNRATDEYGAEFTSDRKVLLWVPRDLESYTIPPYVETIYSKAMAYCIYIKELVIPANVTKIGSLNPFASTAIKIKSESENFTVIDDALYSKDGKRLIHCFTLNNSFRVHDGTEVIGDFAFSTFQHGGEIIMPRSIKNIEELGMADCDINLLVFEGKVKHLWPSLPWDPCDIGKIIVPKGTLKYYRENMSFRMNEVQEAKH